MLSASILNTATLKNAIKNVLSPSSNKNNGSSSSSSSCPFTPSTNSCMIRVSRLPNGKSIYRNDPYRCNVIPANTVMSPVRDSCYNTAPSPLATAKTTIVNTNATTSAAMKKAPAAIATTTASSNLNALSSTSASAPVTHYAIIKFKHETITFVAPFRVAVGDAVFVQGDRGEHLGTVVDIFTETPAYPVPNKITRRAVRKDLAQIDQHREKEAATARSSQALADSVGLNIKIVDCEFQYDMNKLTVFFHSKTAHIDFRKFQRGLFREFRCRIWLSNMAEIEMMERKRIR